MKFYRVVANDLQCGTMYMWVASKVEARAAIKRLKHDHEQCGGVEWIVEQHNIATSKHALLHALRLYASHNNNG